MDPDACRAKMIETANVVHGLIEAASYPPTFEELVRIASKAEELRESVLDLDEWLRMRGFLPRVWAVGGGAAGSVGQQGRKEDVDV